MEDSILTTIKNLLEIDLDDDCFDDELIVHINTCFITLKQIGAINSSFFVKDKTTTWDDLLEKNIDALQSVKTYVFAKVKLLFDPPTSPTVSASYENLIKELEFRLPLEVV